MSNYLNSTEALSLYESEAKRPYFVDKTMLIKEIMPYVAEGNSHICLTRPRRFGKSVMADMLGAFFSKGVSSEELFGNFRISETEEYGKHLNNHNVIFIDFSKVDDECDSYDDYISDIKELLREDLHDAYPTVGFRKEKGSVTEDLKRIKEATGEGFIFIFDEWDAVFHMPFVSDEDCKKYLRFLKNLLKGHAYVELAYMTGILPIAKYSSGSELNMFAEYTMASEEKFSEYFGFTDAEVDQLYKKYLRLTKKPKLTREELNLWYGGYHTKSGERLYTPDSIVEALTNNTMHAYWVSSGLCDKVFSNMKYNVAAVKDDILLMATGDSILANICEYAAVSANVWTRDELLSAMVVYGFLTYKNGKVSIPNKEVVYVIEHVFDSILL